jgi:hypothetical protein
MNRNDRFNDKLMKWIGHGEYLFPKVGFYSSFAGFVAVFSAFCNRIFSKQRAYYAIILSLQGEGWVRAPIFSGERFFPHPPAG